ncbi:MAG: hypothetical protein M3Z09_01515 [Acidobacteriota bacterium]|nr:hypothetical protein [Acidobacteriota bacterium]
MQSNATKRRSFLAIGFSWFPFFHKRDVTLAGIAFHVLRYGHSRRRYLLIHGNEKTARQLLTTWMYTHPGVAYLSAVPTRNVTLSGGAIDPNRLFSRAGAERSFRALNPAWTPAQLQTALDTLDRGRENLIRHLTPPSGGLLVALHNNAEGYNVNEELPNSDQTSIKQPARPHEFFLCTDPDDYKILSTSPYNVVLQNKKPTEDDGSLSRLAAARGFRYVNLETTLGYYEAQLDRLTWLDQHLS